MVRPGDEWPEHPVNAHYHDDEGWWGWQGHGWTVADPPPPPFPFVDPPFDRATYGPPGTVWIFTVAELLAGQVHLPGWAGTAAFNAAVKKLGIHVGGGAIEGWRTPAEPEQQGVSAVVMDWIRTQVVGSIGTDEQFVHVLNWRHSTQENAPIDAVTLKAVGDAVRDGFVSFLGASGNVQGINTVFPDTVRYQEVRASHLHQEGPAIKPEWVGNTTVSPFTTGNVGTGADKALPYEVAMGVSLNTNFRGTSRFRGRLYLGPLTTKVMATQGQFLATVVDGIGGAFGTAVIAAVEAATDYELHVVSQKFNTSAKVTGVRMGETPDSQRRRRRNRPESYAQVWGTPVGAL